LRIPAAQIRERVERVGGAEVVRLRGQLLPLLKLNDVLGIGSTYVDPTDGAEKPDRRQDIADRRSLDILSAEQETTPESRDPDGGDLSIVGDDRRESIDRRYHAESAVNVVVVSTGAVKYGLVVDHLHDSEEIVVKPLGRHLKQCKGYAGATIMGDGRVALILDVGNLVQMAGLASIEGADKSESMAKETAEAITAKRDMQSLLVFRSSEDEQFAVTLSQVERIEKVKSDQVEELGGKKVMHYRGGSLPLFSIDQVANVKPLAQNEDSLVIVFVLSGKEIGLLAIGPVDAVDVSVEVDDQTLKQTGIMGSTIINDRTTQLIDIYELMEVLNPDWFSTPGATDTWQGTAPTILFAEDSAFFRSKVKGFMEDDGYTVIEAEDGVVAWSLMEEHAPEIAAVVTDIEMPNMDGFTLTEKIRADDRFSDLPIIALTTLAGEGEVAKGKAVGIDDYQIKLDREKLLNTVNHYLRDRQ
jgi:two-component system, chemotaxis family, sensor kinase CheA